MSKIFKYSIFIFLFLIFVSSNFSDEGMWMPHQMELLNLKSKGLKMNPANLYKKDGTGLMSAVVYLGGGTCEFVSKEGLILTNHHVAFRAIQRASNKEHDYITNGFLARTKKQEIPAKGYIADVLINYEEITNIINKVLKPNTSYMNQYRALDRAKKRLINRKEKQGKDIRCYIKEMYSGNKYYLFTFKRLRDIRLVYAPPRDIGNYGGDVDNWMWPRHTGDFSFLRAYASKENIGVEYNKDNIPYKPKSYLKISLDGVKEGDFTFVMGYPGRTYRNYTLTELKFSIERMRRSIQLFKDNIDFFEKTSKKDRGVQIKYAGKIKGLNNVLKNYIGKLEGLKKIKIIQKKNKFEKQLMNWVQTSSEREGKYKNMLKETNNFMKKYAEFYWKNDLISKMVSSYYSSTLLSQAFLIYRTAKEKQKPDIKREPAYQKRNLPYIKMRITLAERSYDFATDKAFLKFRLKKIQTFFKKNKSEALKNLILKNSEKEIASYVDELYAKTTLKNPKKRVEMLDLTPKELLKLNDPLINLAADLEKELEVLRERGKALAQEKLNIKKIYLQALMEKSNEKIAPDANSSIRFTYGSVKGYFPGDAVYYNPLTTLNGVMEKEKGKFPFRIPEKLKKLYKQKDYGRYIDRELNSVPVCFLNTTNVTGGNSGSPVLNARGEQVGIVFDMTYESVVGDYYIIPELQRTISVDIRYVIFITDKFAGASNLLKEMELQ